MNAYRKKYEAFYDEIMDTRLTFAASQKSHEEMLYTTACLPTIGNKGRRSDVADCVATKQKDRSGGPSRSRQLTEGVLFTRKSQM